LSILLSARNLRHAYGVRTLFEGVSFTLADGDRVGLIGPNGAGKSTLLKILVGDLAPDGGDIARRGGLRVAMLSQVPELAGSTVRQAVRAGLRDAEHASWEEEARVDEWISKMDLTPDQEVESLSGGWKKRVALARALVADPELLLLDEPTNHLDVDSILWLERLLGSARVATMTVTHDRLFLQRIANRILELDRRNAGGLLDVAGDYATYVERKAEAMAAQERREQTLRNTLRRETEWLRRGPPARSTKQDARIQRAGALATQVSELGARNRTRAVDLDFQSADSADHARPRRLIEARGIAKRYGDHVVFAGIDLFIGPRTRIGLLGPNGCGKSTLLRVLTGQEAPTSGEVLRADPLGVAYFDQNRASLDPTLSVVDTVCPDGDYVQFRGARVHRAGYLERFLFRPEQMDQPVEYLSGGEQSRLVIARLMLQPANVLVLDEPTNDLDLPTLTILEDALSSFDGAVLLVTHDRYFLDQVATQILAFHTRPGEEGQVTAMVGFDQWEAWHATQATPRASRQDPKAQVQAKAVGVGSAPKRKKLSFRNQQDWNTIEARISDAEAKLAALQAECTHPEAVTNGARLVTLHAAMSAARADIDGLYARWAELETLTAAV
jgi:ATP-binding cassette subfamily F protein uup